MKRHLFVLKIIPVKPFVTFITADHVFVFSFFTFCASPRFFKIKDYKTRKSIVVYGIFL